MIVQVIRLKSGLQAGDVQRMYEKRATEFRALPGLVQKYYLRFPATHESGAVYVWESKGTAEPSSAPMGGPDFWTRVDRRWNGQMVIATPTWMNSTLASLSVTFTEIDPSASLLRLPSSRRRTRPFRR